MKLRLRSRLFLVSIGLIGTVGAPTGLFLETQLRRVLTEQIELRLSHAAALAREALADLDAMADPREVDRVADALGEAGRVRVTVVARSGDLLGDSELPLSGVLAAEKHDRRPEVVEALDSGFGRSVRFSTTVGTAMLYVARSHGDLGVVRVATPLSQVEESVSQLRAVLLLGAGFGLLIAVIISALASHVTTRPLLSLVERARSLSEEPGAPEHSSGTHDELGLVAGSLDRLAHELNVSVSALAAERDRRDAVLNTMGEGIVAMDEDLRVQLLNPAAREVLDLQVAGEGRMLVELCRVPDLIELAQKALSKTVSDEFRLGQNLRTIAASGTPLRATKGVLLVLRDVTEVRRLEAIRRDFVANISHELRTPVSVIRANSETLLAGALDDPKQARVFAAGCLRHAERLSNLLSDLLDLSRLEADAYHMAVEWLPLSATVESALSSIAPLAQKRAIELTSQAVPSGLVRGDTQAINQVLVNLLENAVKYTPEGGHVELCARISGKQARFEVRDDGPGVSPKHRARLFERFYRADAGRSRAMGGTGLGLSIVKHLVSNMGGEVGMSPVEPHGCCFWFHLPGAESEPQEVDTQAASSS